LNIAIQFFAAFPPFGEHSLAPDKDLAVSLQLFYLYSWIKPITLRLGSPAFFKTGRHCSHLYITNGGC